MSAMPLRRFLMFRELIHRADDPAERVNTLLKQHPSWNPEEKRSWEAWKEADLPEYGVRSIESIDPL